MASFPNSTSAMPPSAASFRNLRSPADNVDAEAAAVGFICAPAIAGATTGATTRTTQSPACSNIFVKCDLTSSDIIPPEIAAFSQNSQKTLRTKWLTKVACREVNAHPPDEKIGHWR